MKIYALLGICLFLVAAVQWFEKNAVAHVEAERKTHALKVAKTSTNEVIELSSAKVAEADERALTNSAEAAKHRADAEGLRVKIRNMEASHETEKAGLTDKMKRLSGQLAARAVTEPAQEPWDGFCRPGCQPRW